MLLSDVIDEYKFVYDTLSNCKDYIETANSLIPTFCTNTLQIATTFYKANNCDSSRTTFVNSFSNSLSTCYSQITKLISKSYEFYGAISKLETYSFRNKTLEILIDSLVSNAHISIDITHTIINEQLSGIKTKNLLSQLIIPLQNTIQAYYTLIHIHNHINATNEMLFSPIPEPIGDIQYDVLELRSSKEGITISQFSKDIVHLSSFIEQLDIILSKKETYTPIITRKIETGSLRVVWGGTTFELSCISDIIEAITNAIKTFRLTSTEKRIQKATAESLELDNKAKALNIINTQIDTIANKIGLDSTNPEDKETIQRLCLPLVSYINNNPVGQIGTTRYNLTEDLRLLEDFYFTPKEQ